MRTTCVRPSVMTHLLNEYEVGSKLLYVGGKTFEGIGYVGGKIIEKKRKMRLLLKIIMLRFIRRRAKSKVFIIS